MARTAAQNRSGLVRNGGFETGTGSQSTTANWIGDVSYKWYMPAMAITASFDNTVSHSGSQSLKVLWSGTSTNATIQQLVTRNGANITTYLPQIVAGRTYALSAWVKVTGVDGTGVTVRCLEDTESAYNNVNNSCTAQSGTKDWTYVSKTFTAATNTTRAEIGILCNAANGTAWIDDIQLIQTRTSAQNRSGLVRNGGFEVAPAFTAVQTTSNWIDGTSGGSATNNNKQYSWYMVRTTTAVSCQYDSSVYHSGSYSLKLSTTDATGTLRVNNFSTTTLANMNTYAVRLQPSVNYTLSCWVKTNNVATNAVYIGIIQLDSTPTAGTTITSSKLSGTNDWTKITKTFTSDSDAYFGQIYLYNFVAGNVSDAWFDDIQLIQTRSAVA